MEKLSEKMFKFEVIYSDGGKQVTLRMLPGQGVGKKRHGIVDKLLPGAATSQSTYDDEPKEQSGVSQGKTVTV